MTPDQRLRRRYPHVADLPDRPGGWGHDYDRVHQWLCERCGGPLSGRWYLLGLRRLLRQRGGLCGFL